MASGRSAHGSPKRPDEPRRRYLWALTGLPVVAVAAGAYMIMAPGGASTQAQDSLSPAGPAHVGSSARGAGTEVQTASQCTSEGGTATGSGKNAACSVGTMGIAKMPERPSTRPHPKPSATSASASASASASSPGPAPASPTASSPATGTSPSQQGTPADQVLALINQARAQNGLAALTFSSGLDESASKHNLLMADGCGLSHQCPGEAAIGDRETAAGVQWTAAGENIGEEGPVSDDTTDIANAGVALTQDMLNEKPPDDGHRLNILSTTYTHIGIAVYRDSSGTVWMTQDFSN